MSASFSTALRPSWVLARATLLGNLRTLRVVGLVLLASLPTFVVAGLAAYGISGTDLVSAYESIQAAFLPLVLLIITLLVAVPLFRDEIDSQSISYLVTRTIGKPRILLGKYVGAVFASAAILLPTSLVGYAIVAADSAKTQLPLTGVLPSVVVMILLGDVTFVAFFLLLGLMFRRALIWGLLYAFFWEGFVGTLTGAAPDASISYYLLSIPTFWVPTTPSGPLSSYATTLTLEQAVLVPLGAAVVALLLAALVFWKMGLNPALE